MIVIMIVTMLGFVVTTGSGDYTVNKHQQRVQDENSLLE